MNIAGLKDDSNFNSIKVQLEPILLFIESSVWLFQFHKGTIRTHNADYLGIMFTQISIP